MFFAFFLTTSLAKADCIASFRHARNFSASPPTNEIPYEKLTLHIKPPPKISNITPRITELYFFIY
jgi:hypothetical protein